ncbi:MAG: cytochrome c biogenesis CcdA family protein [Galactobacter sp.]|uniref:cytochrome c biogenesis CcdA family protein n=1 Tax=Galactobacter sp. TaxID=2676125 RepID=UPI0025BDA06E|nr:cytochrome c biogenesis protein CcdA [Galactobacter sp.]
MEIGLLGAFVGGVLTLLSPCSVMLLPAFFSYAFTSPAKLMGRTGVFWLGLITTLVPMGVLAGTVGSFVNRYRTPVMTVAACIVILLGILMVLNIPLFGVPGASADGTGTAAVYALGLVYGLAGACTGPLLGAVLTVAGLSGNALMGGLILLCFAAGMAAPLLVLALLWGRLPFVRRLVRPFEVRVGRWRTTVTGLVGGALTVALGVFLLMTQGTTSLGGILGATDQARLENRAMAATSGVPDWVVALVAVAIAAVAWLVSRQVRRRKTPAAS